MTDLSQLITVLVTAAVTFGLTNMTTLINRRNNKSDEREVYERNIKREDSLRFERDAVRIVTELLATTETIFDATNALNALKHSPNQPELQGQKQQVIQSRLQQLQALKVQLTEAMLVVPQHISLELNKVVLACRATMQDLTDAQYLAAHVAYVDSKANLIGHVRQHLGVEDKEPGTATKKSTPRWGALKLRRKS